MNNKDLIEHFAKRAVSFNENGWVDNETVLQTILNGIMTFCPLTESLLDLGAGTGIVSKYLLERLPNIIKIYALDISSDMLSQIQDERIKCVVSSVDSMPFVNSEFELIVSRQCFHYVHDLTKTLVEVKRILKKHGIFILTQFVPLEDETKQYWKELTEIRQPLRVHYYSEDDWIKCFTQNGFLLLSTERFVIVNSFAKWSNQYTMIECKEKQKYISKLLNAPDSYKLKYNITIEGTDIIGKTYGVTLIFESR